MRDWRGFILLFVKDKWFWILFLVCFIILLFPLLFRLFYVDGLLIDGESYYNLRLAEDGLFASDELSFGDNFVIERGWIGLLSISPLFLSRLLPLILGLGSFVFLFFIVSKFKRNLRYIASLLFIISPGFIYLFSVSNKYSVSLFLALLGFYFLINDKKVYWIASFLLVSFFSVGSGIFVLFLVLLYFIFKKVNLKLWWIYFVLLLFVLLVLYYKFLFLGIPNLTGFFVENSFNYFVQYIFSDFGSGFGIGLFLLLLSIYGVSKINISKLRIAFVYAFIFVLFILSLYFEFLLFYLGLFFSVFGAYGLYGLWNQEWKLQVIKRFSMLIIIAGLLFMFGSFMVDHVVSDPSKDMGKAIEYLQDHGGSDIVFSDYKYGDFISYAGNKNFIDRNFRYVKDVDERVNAANLFLHTSDINDVVRLRKKYGIEYILIDDYMRKRLWERKDKELLYLLKYGSERFYKVFESGGVEIYSIV